MLETGEPAEIERRGRLLRIAPVVEPSAVERIAPHPERIIGDPDELVGIGWSESWQPEVPRGPANRVIHELVGAASLQVSTTPFERVCEEALGLGWTRDPFDRLIVAHARIDGARLITRDRTILEVLTWSRFAAAGFLGVAVRHT